MPTDMQIAQEMYANLKPAAVDAARQYLLSRTPSYLNDEMLIVIDADLNPPPDPTHAVIANGQTVNVRQWDASTVPGVATVAGGSLTQVAANPVASKTIVAHNASVVVHSLADANLPGSPGTATVAAGVLTKVNLTT